MIIERWLTSEVSNDKAVYFRKTFKAKSLEKATLKLSALGWVKAFINGVLITDGEFLPGWTDYNKRVAVYSYDITDKLSVENVVCAVVGNGWVKGSTLFGELKKYYAVPSPCLYIRIELTFKDGTTSIVGDDGWECGCGAIGENDIMMGETWDFRLERKDFFRLNFDESALKNAIYFDRKVLVEESVLPKVSVREVLFGRKISEKIYDFGQNFAGVVRLKVKADNFAEITVRHGEMIETDCRLYVGNLRSAKATDRYILTKGEYTLRPWFTYHGFRYAEITVKGSAEILSCDGLAIYAEMRSVGEFSCSDELINKIYSNCVWSLKSNIHYVPTDCPQRDERLGWLGDAGVIARSASYIFDTKEILLNYLSVIAEAVRDDGAIPCIAPNAKGFLDDAIGAAGWSDAFLSILSDYYDFYADNAAVEKYFPVAENFIGWLDNNSQNYRRNTYCFSDWLSMGSDIKEGYGDVDFNLFDLCFYAIDCLYAKKFCLILGKDSSGYIEKYAAAKKYFYNELYSDAVMTKGRQTAYLLAYRAGFLTKEQIYEPLTEDVLKNGITCGFIGVKFLLPTLSEIGRSDIAYSLIKSKDFPSWGYCVKCGATTMWERWDSYTEEKGVNPHGMNSFNHYAFGSVTEWFYSYVLGIKVSSASNRVTIAPTIDATVKTASAEGGFESRFGLIKVKWQFKAGENCDLAVVEVSEPKGADCLYDFGLWTIKEEKRSGGFVIFELVCDKTCSARL